MNTNNKTKNENSAPNQINSINNNSDIDESSSMIDDNGGGDGEEEEIIIPESNNQEEDEELNEMEDEDDDDDTIGTDGVTLAPPSLSSSSSMALECKQCNKQFENLHRLQRHALSHDQSPELRKFKCEFCQKAFKFKHHLKVNEYTYL